MSGIALSGCRWVLPIQGGSLPSKELIGGKAWSIARMNSLGLPVPAAFVITTRACSVFLETGEFPSELIAEIAAGIVWLSMETGRSFGSGPSPLLVSVRSGAPVSMPGMMDTILNLGINEVTEPLLAAECGDQQFARDTHRRFIELYAAIVLKAEARALGDTEEIVSWKRSIASGDGNLVPEDVTQQLHGSVRAVFESWNSRRARRYREHNGVPAHLGTAVVIQAMVFGNLDRQSGTGVLFTRNPVTGAPEAFGEFLPQAQGEDVVSGRFTPLQLDSMRSHAPDAFEQLHRAAQLLERENGDVQDIEFTVERGRLFLLQSRSAKRAPLAAVRIAAEMVREGMADQDTAFGKLTSEQARLVLSPRLSADTAKAAVVIARGEGASPGIGVGYLVSDPDQAEARARQGEDVVLARAITSPNDLHGMIASRAIVTEQGGSTSHAAVVGRALGRPCVVGCGPGTLLRHAGKAVTVDGAAGIVYEGRLELVVPDENADESLVDLLRWAERRSPVSVVRSPAPDTKIIDLDAIEDGTNPLALRSYLGSVSPNVAIRGRLLSSEAAVEVCVTSGAKVLIANPRLPVLLAAIRAAAHTASDASEEVKQ